MQRGNASARHRLGRLLGPRRSPEPRPPGSSPGKRLANSLIHDWLRRHDGLRLRVGFVCECPSASCSQSVWLTGEQFARARLDPAWIALGDGHEALDGGAAAPRPEPDRGGLPSHAGSCRPLLARSE